MNAVLALENGTWYRGTAAGATGVARGEVVFNTSMTGYQEVLTDPSYAGQIVTMTSPQIGNYGVAAEDVESRGPQVAGFVMRDASPMASNWRAEGTLRDYLTQNGVVAITGIDTRALTRVLRTAGVMRGVVGTGHVDPEALVAEAGQVTPMAGLDLVRTVSCAEPFDWPGTADDAGGLEPDEFRLPPERRANRPLRIAAYDFGLKRNILRRLAAHGCQVRVFPATAPAEDLLAIEPDGVFLSNGPGDPSALPYAVAAARALLEADLPIFGICLGHQVLAQAMGATTYKLKFGHRGANHPVKQLSTGQIEITHLNLYDGTIEGLRHTRHPAFCVQYHPEASPGPHDADYLFSLFLDAMERRAV